LVRYPESGSTAAPSVTGAMIDATITIQPPAWSPWLPSSWPPAPVKVDESFVETLHRIFQESILDEVDNVIADANGNLSHRGHVIAIALLCALDAVSSYAYRDKKLGKGRLAPKNKALSQFVAAHFPADYQPYDKEINKLYRNCMIHNWNLFEAAIQFGDQKVDNTKGILSFGLLSFRDALEAGIDDFLLNLKTKHSLQTTALKRYRKLRSSAKK
jgi:hypothetical protein